MENYNFAHLEKNLSDMIFEGLIKIGYEDKAVSVYYDTGLIGFLLDTDIMGEAEMENCLEQFREYGKSQYGELRITSVKGRYEFCVPKEGVKYIYGHNDSRIFLKKLVSVLKQPDCGLEQIVQVFREVSEEIIIEEIDHSEFQYVITFRDKSIDEFHYCFTFDEMGHYYHRLLDYDFDQVVHCHC